MAHPDDNALQDACSRQLGLSPVLSEAVEPMGLFDLPTEIRLHLYGFMVQDRASRVGLAVSCRQIHKEVVDFIYKDRTLVFDCLPIAFIEESVSGNQELVKVKLCHPSRPIIHLPSLQSRSTKLSDNHRGSWRNHCLPWHLLDSHSIIIHIDPISGGPQARVDSEFHGYDMIKELLDLPTDSPAKLNIKHVDVVAHLLLKGNKSSSWDRPGYVQRPTLGPCLQSFTNSVALPLVYMSSNVFSPGTKFRLHMTKTAASNSDDITLGFPEHPAVKYVRNLSPASNRYLQDTLPGQIKHGQDSRKCHGITLDCQAVQAYNVTFPGFQGTSIDMQSIFKAFTWRTVPVDLFESYI